MKKRLFFDMDNVLVDFQSGLDKVDEETKNEFRAKNPGEKDRLDEIPGLSPFFRICNSEALNVSICNARTKAATVLRLPYNRTGGVGLSH